MTKQEVEKLLQQAGFTKRSGSGSLVHDVMARSPRRSHRVGMASQSLAMTPSRTGYHYQRSGGKHDIWLKSGFPPIPVPRHKGDLPRGTLNNILKNAGLQGKS